MTDLPAHALTIRPAGADDALEILDWRNDPLTRAMSRQAASIAPDRHLEWYAAALVDPRRYFLIGEAGGARIGMVRFDRCTAAEWEVSIMLAPAARGRRLAVPLLEGAIGALVAARPATRILAEVRPENAASLALFARAGFAPCGDHDGLRRFSLDAERARA